MRPFIQAKKYLRTYLKDKSVLKNVKVQHKGVDFYCVAYYPPLHTKEKDGLKHILIINSNTYPKNVLRTTTLKNNFRLLFRRLIKRLNHEQ